MQAIQLPEITISTFPFAQCSVHPGRTRVVYLVCPCVLQGEPVAGHAEPGPSKEGYVFCARCPRQDVDWWAACPLCVDYHLLKSPAPVDPLIYIPDPDWNALRTAESEGFRAVQQRFARNIPTPPRNEYSGTLRWAFDLGARCAVTVLNSNSRAKGAHA